MVWHDFWSDHDDCLHCLTVLIIAWVLRAVGFGWQSRTQGDTPLDTLNHRFARGEIDRAEYQERKQLLSES